MRRGFKAWCERYSLAQRKELDLHESDPLDPLRLAEHLGILVWTVADIPGLEKKYLDILTKKDSVSWSAATLCTGDTHLIIHNPSHSAGRTNSNLTHEMAHIICEHKPARVDVSEQGLLILDSYSKDQEQEADWFAGCLLLPRPALMYIKSQGYTTDYATKRYGVSNQMLTYRLRMTGVNKQFGYM